MKADVTGDHAVPGATSCCDGAWSTVWSAATCAALSFLAPRLAWTFDITPCTSAGVRTTDGTVVGLVVALATPPVVAPELSAGDGTTVGLVVELTTPPPVTAPADTVAELELVNVDLEVIRERKNKPAAWRHVCRLNRMLRLPTTMLITPIAVTKPGLPRRGGCE